MDRWTMRELKETDDAAEYYWMNKDGLGRVAVGK